MDTRAPVILAVPASEFAIWQDKLDWHLSSFVERSGGSLTKDRLLEDILDQEYQVWVVLEEANVKACALTFIQDDATKTCVISHCAGEDFENWFEQLLVTIRVWSFSLGSTKLEAITRPGWERVLRPLGMVKTHVILELQDNGKIENHNVE